MTTALDAVTIAAQARILAASLAPDPPAPGETVRDLGHGVTVVRRNAPQRPDLPGAAWVAPYAVNCQAHGWIVSRATERQAGNEGHAHIARDHGVTLTCPVCGSHDLEPPYDNGYIPDATFCHGCESRMTSDAATPGSDAHAFISEQTRRRAS